jgi:hypothetical protein
VPPDKAQDQIDKRGPFLHSYSYVELEPSEKFAWTPGDQRLPDKLVPFVARVAKLLEGYRDRYRAISDQCIAGLM